MFSSNFVTTSPLILIIFACSFVSTETTDTVHPFIYTPTQFDSTIETEPDPIGLYFTSDSRIPLFPAGRQGHATGPCGADCVLLFGGHREDVEDQYVFLGDLWEYRLGKNRWHLQNPQGFGPIDASTSYTTFWNGIFSPSAPATYPGSRAHMGGQMLGLSDGIRTRLFGGQGFAAGGGSGLLMDVWDWNFQEFVRQWTFRSIADLSEEWVNVGEDSVSGDVLYPASRAHAGLWVVGNDLVVMGGGPADFEPIVWRFVDVETKWKIVVSGTPDTLPYTLWCASTWSDSSDRLYLFGGKQSPTDVNTKSFFSFDMELLVWSDLSSSCPSVPALRERYSPRADIGMTSNGREIAVVVGGRYEWTDHGVMLADCWMFESDVGWTMIRLTEMGSETLLDAVGKYFQPDAYWSARSFHALTFVKMADKFVLFGGTNDDQRTASRFATLADVWISENINCFHGRAIGESESGLCSDHGLCFDETGGCVCDYSYFGANCSDRCDSQTVCSGHGQCVNIDPEVCVCEQGFDVELDCSVFGCFGKSHNASDVCSAHGDCRQGVDGGFCVCQPPFDGVRCERWDCRLSEDLDICGEFGFCATDGTTCECQSGYSSASDDSPCSQWSCSSTLHDLEVLACSGRGICVAPDECVCEKGTFGRSCETQVLVVVGAAIGSLIVAIVLIGVVVGIIVALVLCLARARRGNKTMNGLKFRLLEEEEDEDFNVADVQLDPKLFVVDHQDLVLVRRLGGGGSASVFLAKWKGLEVAVKTFRLDALDPVRLSTFAKEVEVMDQINHPSIIRFFGISLWAPRYCLVLEYCSHGDLKKFLLARLSYSLEDRLRICREVAAGMSYLHSHGIIHRDLKPENVFVSEDESIRIGDFGLSRADSMTVSKTGGIGTAKFIAPEMTLGTDYNNSVDVYAYSITAFEVLSNDFRTPYRQKGASETDVADGLVHFRAASDPAYRPDLGRLRDRYGVNLDFEWLLELFPLMWSSEPQERPSFEEIRGKFESH